MLEILFQYGSVTIRTFNVILALAFLFGGIYLIRYANRRKMNMSFLAHHVFTVLLAMLIGGRILYVLENIELFTGNPAYILFVWDLNFSFFGVLYGMVAALIFLVMRYREDFWSWLDACTLSTLLAMVFIHIGHFFNGTQYGIPTDLPWGIAFDVQNIPYLNPIHPTQLYAALLALIIFIYISKKSKRTDLFGIVGTLGLMLYSLGMMGIDFLHGDQSIYVKVSYGAITALSFISLVHCSHKKLTKQIQK
jgi:phosphatidylglycerol:prolipoprotein diacylglycerol transferase